MTQSTGQFTGGLLVAAAGVLLTGILSMLLSRRAATTDAMGIKV